MQKITFVIGKSKKLPPPELHSLAPICIKCAYSAPTEDPQLYPGGGLLIKAEEGKEGAVRKGRAEEKGGVYVGTFVHSTRDEPPQILDRLLIGVDTRKVHVPMQLAQCRFPGLAICDKKGVPDTDCLPVVHAVWLNTHYCA